MSLQQIAKAPPQNIDRIQLLNDKFDYFDEFDDNITDNTPELDQKAKLAPEKPKSKYSYHKPMDEESALKCLKMMKDMKLFNSVLS